VAELVHGVTHLLFVPESVPVGGGDRILLTGVDDKGMARICARVANGRAGALRKATSTLVARYDAIVVEDLNIAGIIRNRHLAPACGKRGC
jgi:hypothetical protein